MDNQCMYITPVIKMISEAIERRANERLTDYNITASQVRLLGEICKMDNKECTLKELEKSFSYSSSAIAGLVSRLEAKGYLEGFASTRDKRIKCVRLLPAGESVIKQAMEVIKELEQEMLLGISSDERESLRQTLIKAYKEIC